MGFKTTNYEYNGIKFMSQGEVKAYQELEKTNFGFKYQPEPIQIIPAFTSSSGKKYPAMNYEADFLIYAFGVRVYVEVKGQNDNIYIYRKGQKPQIKDQSELYRLRHKLFDFIISDNVTMPKSVFMVVRDNQLKTPEWAGMFWDKDLQQLRKFKKQGKKELCAKVPRFIERLTQLINDNK